MVPLHTVETVDQLINRDPGLSEVRAVVAENNDPSHGYGHVMRVVVWTLRLKEEACDPREAIAAALLHDVVNLPKNHPQRELASVLSADRAAPILMKAGFSDEAVARIQAAIRDHSYSRGVVPTNPLGQAVHDADRLEALGAIGILRCAATGERIGSHIFHDRDPFAVNRPLDDQTYAVDHFFTKLLKIRDKMVTEGGRTEAERRTVLLRRFLTELGHELGVDAPVLS